MGRKAPKTLEPGRLSKRNLWGYSMGGIGRDMTYTLVNTYITLFALATKSLTPAEYAAIGVIMIVCRIFDGLNDPIMGMLIEKTRTKVGKFKPWIMIGMITNIVIVMLMFFVPLQGASYVVFFGFMYLLWGITYTMNDIAYWGMMPSLTSNAEDRNNLATIANVGAGLGMGACLILIPVLTAGDFALFGNTQTAYQLISGVICLLFAGCQIMTCMTVQEKPLPPLTEEEIAEREAKKAEKEAFKQMSKEEKAQVREAKKAAKAEAKANGTKKDNALVGMFKVIFKNDQVLVTAGSMLLYNIGSAIMNVLVTYWVYLKYGYNGMLVTVFTALTGISMAIVVLYPILSKKMTRKQLMKVCFGAICGGYAIMLILALATNHLDLSNGTEVEILRNLLNLNVEETALFISIAIFGAIASFGQALFYQVLTISMTNTIEYNDLKTGKRDEGMIFSVRPFMAKMGSSIVKAIETIVLVAIGYAAISEQISGAIVKEANKEISNEAMKITIENALNSVDDSAIIWLMVCMAVLPVAFLICAFILYMKKYKIDEVRYEEICAEIRKRDGIEEEQCECECHCDCEDGECHCDCEDGECHCDCHDGDEEHCTCGCCEEHTPEVEEIPALEEVPATDQE
ncbi:MAG: MFS transporter [Clostridia bacterium]|nr:MFS transporter [Clostridia bacterium]